MIRPNHLFICIRRNAHCREGEWFFSEDYGDLLYKARVTPGPNKSWKIRQVSTVGIPFDTLADHIVEPGFQIPRSQLDRLSAAPRSKEIADFQREVEEIVEPELEKRNREADPTISEKGPGIILTGRGESSGD